MDPLIPSVYCFDYFQILPPYFTVTVWAPQRKDNIGTNSYPDQMELAISWKLRAASLSSRDTEAILGHHTLERTAVQTSAQLSHDGEQVLSPLPLATNYENSYLFPHTVAMALKQPDASW